MSSRMLTFVALLAVMVFSIAVTLPVSAAEIAVQKTVDFDGDGIFTDSETHLIGQLASWKVVVTNTGDSAVTDIAVTDDTAGALGTVSLAPGQSETYEYTSPIDLAGTFVNTATAQGVDELGEVVGPVSDTAEVIATDRLDESAWAGEMLFSDKNWATYFQYEVGAGTDVAPVEYPLYAGQSNLAGSVLVYDDGAQTLYVKYVASGLDSDPAYLEGFSGAWTGLTEYHLHAVAALEQFAAVRASKGKGSPSPGQFLYSETFEEITAETEWIAVDITGFSADVFIAAHAVVWWTVAPIVE